jgi:hypothetical protein
MHVVNSKRWREQVLLPDHTSSLVAESVCTPYLQRVLGRFEPFHLWVYRKWLPWSDETERLCVPTPFRNAIALQRKSQVDHADKHWELR